MPTAFRRPGNGSGGLALIVAPGNAAITEEAAVDGRKGRNAAQPPFALQRRRRQAQRRIVERQPVGEGTHQIARSTPSSTRQAAADQRTTRRAFDPADLAATHRIPSGTARAGDGLPARRHGRVGNRRVARRLALASAARSGQPSRRSTAQVPRLFAAERCRWRARLRRRACIAAGSVRMKAATSSLARGAARSAQPASSSGAAASKGAATSSRSAAKMAISRGSAARPAMLRAVAARIGLGDGPHAGPRPWSARRRAAQDRLRRAGGTARSTSWRQRTVRSCASATGWVITVVRRSSKRTYIQHPRRKAVRPALRIQRVRATGGGALTIPIWDRKRAPDQTARRPDILAANA